MSRRSSIAFFVWVAVFGCGGPQTPAREQSRGEVAHITLIGTNDLHGHIRALPILGAYVDNLRAAQDGVVLLDGGDMFQGTLESNLREGAPIVRAYSALGYDAVTIGNHEFDYGPVGRLATPEGDENPRGALLARVAQADYPFLSANLLVRETGERVDWEGVLPTAIFERGGLRVGVIGITTEHTLTTTLPANVADLEMRDLAEAVTEHAAALREDGAQLIFVAAHAGGICEAFDDPHDLSSCDPAQEIFEVAEQLPAGSVNAIVAGHTHRAVAHVVAGIPIIESYSYGRAFGRIDFDVNTATGEILETRILPPQDLCVNGRADDATCELPPTYAGNALTPRQDIAEVAEEAVAFAARERERPLGVTFSAEVEAVRGRECALGNLFTDLMLEAAHEADVAITNGGGLRANLPAGGLRYGALYEATPFDNGFAYIEMSALELAQVFARNLQGSSGALSISGLRVVGRCSGDGVEVYLEDEAGRVEPQRRLRVVTTDYLATSNELLAAMDHRLESHTNVRDAMAARLSAQGGEIDPTSLYNPSTPRVVFGGERPLRCADTKRL